MDSIEIVAIIAITLIELLVPRKNLKFFRKGFFEDISYVLIIIYVIPFLYDLLPWTLDSFLTYHLFDFSKRSIIVQIFACFVLTDFLRFMLHYSFHRLSFYWPVHKLHHTTKELTSLSGYRAGYWEDISLLVFTIIPMSFLKFNSDVVAGVVIFFSVQGYFLHANVKLQFPRFLRFIASPQFHSWHHSNEEKFPYGQNFGVVLTVWDIILGTYYSSDEYPEVLGLYNGETMEGNYISRYFYPLTGRKKNNS